MPKPNPADIERNPRQPPVQRVSNVPAPACAQGWTRLRAKIERTPEFQDLQNRQAEREEMVGRDNQRVIGR